MGAENVTLRNIIVVFSNRTGKSDTVIVDWGAIGCLGEISTGPTNGECNKLKPFDRANGEPLNVTKGDGKCKNLLVFNVQINFDHVSEFRHPPVFIGEIRDISC